MKKSASFFGIIFLVGSLLLLERCINKNDMAPNKDYAKNKAANDTLNGGDLSTLPGNNFFNLTTDGIHLYSLSLASAHFITVRGKCDTTTSNGQNVFIIFAQSESSNSAYSSITLATKPVTSKVLPLVAYDEVPLTENNAWATITIIKDNKTWRAINGFVNIEADSNNISARFDSVSVESISNNTDTTYYKMSGVFICK